MAWVPENSFDVTDAIRRINNDYGVNVTVLGKKKALLKFWESRQVQTTKTTLMELPTGVYNETYVYQNIIDSFSSSSSSDTFKMVVEGHICGDDDALSSLTQTAGTATATTSAEHGYATGDWVLIDGAVETEYNGIVEITVTGADTFTFSVDSGATSPATGTITSTNQDKTFLSQEATVDGQNKVTLSTPLCRVTRAYIPAQDRITDVDAVGDIYFYEDTAITSGVPTDGTKVHLMVTGSNQNNNSLKASTSLSSQDFWIVTGIQGHLLEKSAAFADVDLEYRTLGGAWREVDKVAVTGGSEVIKFKPLVIIPPNSDVRMRSKAGAANKYVGGSTEGYLAIITS